MITVEQIRLLESRVTKAVDHIRLLRDENAALKRTVESSQARMEELEALVQQFKSAQTEIEQGVVRALENLERLEDEVTGEDKSEEQKTEGPAQESPAPADESDTPGEAIVDSEQGEDEDLDIF